MNKAQLVQEVSERLEIRRQEAADVVEAVLESITERVASGERVAISGFGIFEQVFRQARIGRNPRTGETVTIGAVTLPKFRPGRDFRNLVAGVREATGLGADEDVEAASTEPSTAKAPPAKKTTARTTKKAPAKKAAAKKTSATKATTKKAPAKRAAAKKSSAPRKAPATKSAAAKIAPAKKAPAKKAPAVTKVVATDELPTSD